MLKKFKKVISFFNIPSQIKKFFLKRKISKHSNKNLRLKSFLKFILGIFILGGIIYLNFKYRNLRIMIGSIILVLVFFIFRVVSKDNNKKIDFREEGKKDIEITEIILQDENERIIKSWYVYECYSFLIGKKTKKNMVDIDLSESTYAPLISREHAVMNKTSKGWYFEDVGSSNGSGIKKGRSNKKFKVEPDKPYRLYSGDTIYIANTKLLIK